jgi:hypothetical protein
MIDDPGVRRVKAMVLENSGYGALTAPDGETGVEVCLEESLHIVITDISSLISVCPVSIAWRSSEGSRKRTRETTILEQATAQQRGKRRL